MVCSNRFLRSNREPGRSTTSPRPLPGLLAACALLCVALGAHAQEPAEQASSEPGAEVTEMDTIQVIEKRPQQLYRSRPVERTPPTVFERDWRDPVNLRRIGLEGGVVPLFMRYLSKEAPKAAEKYIPGWKAQVSAAAARPPPLDEAQMQRAAEMQDRP